MADFDPDAYLKSTPAAAPAFDPDAYLKASAPPAQSLSAGETAADVAKSGGIGLAKGAIGLAGLPGDVGSLVSAGADKLGVPESVKSAVKSVGRHVPVFGAMAGPTSQDIQQGVEGVTGEFYKPKTTAGEYAQTAGEFAPAVIGGPESLLAKVGTRVAAPAFVSETAGQATKGTPLEPYGRAAGAVIGSVAAHHAVTPPVKQAVPSVEQLKDAARAGYRHPDVTSLEIHPGSTAQAADDITSSLNAKGFRALNAPATYGILQELKNPVGPTSKVADVDSVRKALTKTAGNYANPIEQQAANQAIAKIDDYLTNIPQSHVVAGDAARAQQVLKEAQANWSAAKHGETMAGKMSDAELQAAATYSGGNLDNATRQKIKSILTSPKLKRGYTADELKQMDQIVRGTFTGNLSRKVGKILGGGGGLGSLVTAAEGAHVAGPAGLALPLVGMAGRALGTRSTLNRANQLEETIRSRSPEARKWAASHARTAPALTSQPGDMALLPAAAYSEPLRLTVRPQDALGAQDQGRAKGGRVWHPAQLGAKRAKDGHWYLKDENRPGKYLRVERKASGASRLAP